MSKRARDEPRLQGRCSDRDGGHQRRRYKRAAGQRRANRRDQIGSHPALENVAERAGVERRVDEVLILVHREEDDA